MLLIVITVTAQNYLFLISVVAMLEDRGLLTYKDKISNHWPKFADGDQRKKNICVADLMKHQAGPSIE